MLQRIGEVKQSKCIEHVPKQLCACRLIDLTPVALLFGCDTAVLACLDICGKHAIAFFCRHATAKS